MELNESHPQGDVFLTADFALLFARADLSAGDSRDTLPERRLLRPGVTLVLKKKFLPIVANPKDVDSLNHCLGGIGKLLKDKFAEMPIDATKETAVISGLGYERVSRRMPNIDFGDLAIAYQKFADVREDSIIAVEFTPTQRFNFSEPENDPKFIQEVEQLVPKLKKNSASGISVSLMSEHYERRTLVAVSSHFKSLGVSIDQTDIELIPLTPSVQKLTPLVTSRWFWKARFNDKHDSVTLRLRIIDPSADKDPVPLYYHALDIPVQIPWDYRIQKFFSNYWQWITVTFVIPIGLYIWRQRPQSSKTKPVNVPYRHRL